MSKSSEKKSLNNMSIELTTTAACNFKCEYCFENDCSSPSDKMASYNIDDLIIALKKLFEDEWYKDTFDTTQLVFWGGEPTLNFDFIERIVEEFRLNGKVSFYIYTNGSRINQLLPILKSMKYLEVNGKPKFGIQISYDGNPVHDKRRIAKSGSLTAKSTEEAMTILSENYVPYSLKATLAHKDFMYMPECWEDFKRLYERFGDNINYSLTVDYHNIQTVKYFNELETALIRIAEKEYQFYKLHKRFLSNIFSSNKLFCSAGKKMLAVDIDGKMYYCHGCIYSDRADELSRYSIFDERLVDLIRYNYNFFYDSQRSIKECEDCVALTCIRCNVKKYETSKQSGFLNRWHDYPSQGELCLYYKTAGRIGRALINLLQQDKLWSTGG